MKIFLPLILVTFLCGGCSDESDEPAKYQFGFNEARDSTVLRLR
jgi:hypothetical protein